MEPERFDTVAKALGAGTSRRRVAGLAAGWLATGIATGLAALALAPGAPSGAQPGCRGAGNPCEGNQQCCAGLVCTVIGQGNARRCMAAPTRTPTPTSTPTPTPVP
jgi:hypothetical protein